MNLSQVQVSLEDTKPELQENVKTKLQAEESRLLKIIEALQGISQSKEWSTLKTEVFDNLVNVLDKELRTEAKKNDPDPKKLNRLSGELKWAERYSDMQRLENSYRVQLQNVRLQLYGKSEKTG